MSQEAQARQRVVLSPEEISRIAESGGKPAETLLKVVALIATRFETDLCSAYLLEPDRSNLVLAATTGLKPSASEGCAWGCTKVSPDSWPSR